MFFRRLQSYKNLFLAMQDRQEWMKQMPVPKLQKWFKFIQLIMGSETVNAVPFPNSVSKVIVPL